MLSLAELSSDQHAYARRWLLILRPELASTSYTRSDVPNSVSVSDSAHCCWLLPTSATDPQTRINQRQSALVSA